ncbi:MAG: RDD family protein, partial [Pseudomonadota bacterium]
RLTKAEKQARKRERQRLVIMPPEGVSLTLVPAGLGARLGSQLLDLFITIAFLVAFIWAALYAFDGFSGGSFILILLAVFFIRVPYYVICEIILNGQTLSKKLLGLRTVSINGRGLTIYQIVVRNLMREIEFFAPVTYLLAFNAQSIVFGTIAAIWSLVVVIVPFRNRWNQRLGDILADTAVIETPKPTLLSDVAVQSAGKVRDTVSDAYAFTRAQLDYYGRHELQVLEQVLREGTVVDEKKAFDRSVALLRIVRQIQRKIGHDAQVKREDAERFLEAFYRAQRTYLEERGLMGDRRDNKFYREGTPENASSGG